MKQPPSAPVVPDRVDVSENSSEIVDRAMASLAIAEQALQSELVAESSLGAQAVDQRWISPPSMTQILHASYQSMRIATVVLALYWTLIFTGTHLPRVPMPNVKHGDKVLHLGAFAGLAFLLAISLPLKSRQAKIAAAFGIALAYACFDELSQTLVPGRTADWLDLVADSFGALAGLAAYLMATTLFRNIRPQPIGPNSVL